MEHNKKTIAAVALGELLIDFTEAGISKNGMRLFEQNPGGAPANFLTVLSHFGFKTEFIGKVGCDMHGKFLKQTLQREKIGVKNLIEDEEYFTTLAFVSINNGEREFSFARKHGADTRINAEELNAEILSSCRIFHFGSLSLTSEPAKTATVQAVERSKAAGALISYDPNYRESLWSSQENAVKEIRSMLKYVDMLKVSDEESLLLTGESSIETAAKKLMSKGVKLVAVTLGSGGAAVASKNGIRKINTYQVKALDTTGAGDSFWGGFVSTFLQTGKDIDELNEDEIVRCAKIGNATAAICVSGRGGIPSIPTKAEVEKFIATRESTEA